MVDFSVIDFASAKTANAKGQHLLVGMLFGGGGLGASRARHAFKKPAPTESERAQEPSVQQGKQQTTKHEG